MKRFVLSSLLIFGCPIYGQELPPIPEKSLMPENELHLLDTMTPINVSEGDFEAVLDQVEAYYRPMIKTLYNVDLIVSRDWEDPTVNAYATRRDGEWEIHMFGGLARRPEITKDGFALVACHEMGHHLGGFPFVQDWAANEGQADYFSTLACARALWKDERAQVRNIPQYPKQLCDASWSALRERELCYRMIIAGKSLADLLSLRTARFETPDRTEVSSTVSSHPNGQCRLDTYMAGALCHAQFDQKMIPQDETSSAKVSCLQSRNEKGYRPRCWFKPSM